MTYYITLHRKCGNYRDTGVSKNSRGYHIPMIDLGEIEKITAVLKLFLISFTMVRSDLDFLVNIFEKRSFWCF
jgi:hypothetical protein